MCYYVKETALWFALFEPDTEAVRGVDYAGHVSFSLDSWVLDMLRF